MGRPAARNIVRRIEGRPTQPFRYRDWGSLATIGRNAAVVDRLGFGLLEPAACARVVTDTEPRANA